MDTLHSANLKAPPKKDESTPSSIPFPKQGGKFRPFSSSKAEPSFKSHLIGSSDGVQEATRESSSTTSQSYVPKT